MQSQHGALFLQFSTFLYVHLSPESRRLLTETENKSSSLVYKIVYQMRKNKLIKSEYINNGEIIINMASLEYGNRESLEVVQTSYTDRQKFPVMEFIGNFYTSSVTP